MKKIVVLLMVLGVMTKNAWGQNGSLADYLDEMQALGTVSGTAMACGSPKYDTFEMLARAILITKAASDKMQKKGMIAYNTAKADAFIAKQSNKLLDCNEINARFDKQKIFKTTLYRDGTIKMYDGKVFHPRHPYDATLLKEDENANRKMAISIYKNNKNQLNENSSKNVGAGPDLGNVAVAKPTGKILTRGAVSEAGGIRHISGKKN